MLPFIPWLFRIFDRSEYGRYRQQPNVQKHMQHDGRSISASTFFVASMLAFLPYKHGRQKLAYKHVFGLRKHSNSPTFQEPASLIEKPTLPGQASATVVLTCTRVLESVLAYSITSTV